MFDYTLYKQKVLNDRNFNTIGFIEAEVLERLIDKLSFIKIAPKKILCLGSSVGQLSKQIKNKYPHAQIFACDLLPNQTTIGLTQSTNIEHISHDIDSGLPYQDNTFDLIISNLTLHKLEHTEHFIREIRRILSNQGMCLLSMFGVETLKEIAIAWQAIDTYPHIQSFYDMHDIGDLALQAGFEQPVLDVEIIKLTYNTADKVIQDIRALHDPLAHTVMRQTLTGKKRWYKFTEQLKTNSPIQITYEIIYGHMIKHDTNTAKLKNNAAKITLESLKETLTRK